MRERERQGGAEGGEERILSRLHALWGAPTLVGLDLTTPRLQPEPKPKSRTLKQLCHLDAPVRKILKANYCQSKKNHRILNYKAIQ